MNPNVVVAGLSMLAFRAQDSAAVAAIANDCSGVRVLAPDGPLHWHERPGTDRERDLVVARSPAGDVLGYVRIYADPPFDEPIFMAATAPGLDERLGEALCSYAEERANQLTTATGGGSLLARMPSSCEIARRILIARGYREERHLLSLTACADAVRARLVESPEIAIEEGGQADLRQAYETLAGSFKDHWGTSWPSYACWRHDMSGVPLIAYSGSEAVGVLVVASSFVEARDSAQFVELGVIPGKRRGGVAQALLRRGAEWALQHGRARIGLYMDGESATGAKEMFETLGFISTERFTYWSKPVAGASRATAP